MRSRPKQKVKSRARGSGIMGAVFFAVIAVMIIYGLFSVGQSSSYEEKRLLEESLRKAAVSCYAIEGAYPPSLQYLTQNYGVIINHDKYAVHYSIFASNIIPDITVIDLSNPQHINENFHWEKEQ